MTDVSFTPQQLLDQQGLVDMLTQKVREGKTYAGTRTSKVRSAVSTGLTKVGTGIADAYKSTKTRVAQFWDRHDGIREATVFALTFTWAFTVTLFLITGVLFLYIFTLNWVDALVA